MELFAAHLLSLVLQSGFAKLEQSETACNMSLHNLFWFMLSMLDGEEKLKAEDMCLFLNSSINKASEVEDTWLKYTEVP